MEPIPQDHLTSCNVSLTYSPGNIPFADETNASTSELKIESFFFARMERAHYKREEQSPETFGGK